METSIHTNIDTITLELHTPVLDDRPVFVSGNFCKWYPDMEQYRLHQIGPGHYRFVFPEELDLPEKIEYKYTRGGWDQVELDSEGKAPKNRVLDRTAPVTHDFVPHWRRNGVSLDTTYMPILELFSQNFRVPQLQTERKVYVLLPHAYHEQPNRRYPVLYMLDAQNLFGKGSAFGSWGIDRKMAVLASRQRGDVIIVAIDHGEEKRIQEFSPYNNPKHGKGKGREFLRFITDTLKPQVDQRYRTEPHRLHTGIGGSSLGGLMAAYAGLMHPNVFGKLMVFSPSLWISPRIYFDASHFFEPLETRMYLYGGQKEGANMVQNLEFLYETLEQQGYGYDRVKLRLEIDPTGQHQEERWGEEFPKALEWLYY
ncbi:alpha/beta hydrolase [Arundinibacter roseus]|uniref:Alpha/beta hydrolase n=1 Tax=Arundinibacter roseus TaxID=2070510 RepID=A0A4R4KBY5_9BACT|nr:alpha/beta hydrolase-fold protein [Arundinibacter roseus]TDB65360.1 alpha/beta hydrolase [Arundinibacter roseus]